MIEFFRSWIVNIVVVIIFIVFIEMIIPSDKFKKYVKLVTGLVLMIMIINPIVKLVDEGYSLDKITIDSFNVFDNGQIQADTKRVQGIQNSQIVNVYKENLTKEIKSTVLAINNVKSADVSIDIIEDTKSKNFGEIKGLKIKIDLKNQDNNQLVKKIDVNITKEEKPGDKVINDIKEALAQTYDIQKEKINITTQ